MCDIHRSDDIRWIASLGKGDECHENETMKGTSEVHLQRFIVNSDIGATSSISLESNYVFLRLHTFSNLQTVLNNF